jgi:hypothetical protein
MSAIVRLTALAVCAAGGAVAGLAFADEGAPAASVSTRASSPPAQDLTVPYDGQYQFVRIRFEERGMGGFSGFGRRGRAPMWAHDYPRADRNFLSIIDETTHVRTRLDGTNVLTADDPRLALHPIAYIVEVGAWNPTEEEVAGLSAYLQKGGFLIVDDFRGRRALDNLARQVARILPGARLMPLEDDHRIWDSFFRVVPHDVIPPYGNEPPIWFAVYEDNDPERRIMMVINYNNDLGDYWEYSDMGYYPIDLSNEAYKLGVNFIVYAYTN